MNYPGHLTDKRLAEALLVDLEDCRLIINGSVDEQVVRLAELTPQADGVVYEPFDKRFDLIMEGRIERDDCPPLTYCLKGKQIRITGRCSMIPKVCGVDLYLSHSYTGRKGDIVWQKMKIYLDDIRQALKSS